MVQQTDNTIKWLAEFRMNYKKITLYNSGHVETSQHPGQLVLWNYYLQREHTEAPTLFSFCFKN